MSEETGLPDRWSAAENIAWRTEIPGRGWSCPIVWGDRVILTTTISEGQEEEAKKGIYPFQRIHPDARAFTASPWAYDEKIFCLSEDGDTFVIQAGPEMKVLAKNSLGEMCLSSPALVPNALIIRTTQALYRIGESPPHESPSTR